MIKTSIGWKSVSPDIEKNIRPFSLSAFVTSNHMLYSQSFPYYKQTTNSFIFLSNEWQSNFVEFLNWLKYNFCKKYLNNNWLQSTKQPNVYSIYAIVFLNLIKIMRRRTFLDNKIPDPRFQIRIFALSHW